MIKVKQGDWIAFCKLCKGGVTVRGLAPRNFTCWNCGGEDIRQIPGVEVYISQ